MVTPFVLAAVVLFADPAPSDFRTDVAPRVDPVFGDTASLRRRLDRFAVLSNEMQSVADQFSTAVHDTLAELAKVTGDPSHDVRAKGKSERHCRSAIVAAYDRARSAGTHYVALGRDLDLEMREIRLAENYGDTVALTPDYRHKVEQARQDHASLLRVLREMQVAFHDQLETEMHFVGCDTNGAGLGELATDDDDGAADGSPEVPPAPPAKATATPAATASIVSIVIDSTHCPQQSHVTVDGKPLGPVDGGRRTFVRLAQGPHDFCVLPSSDTRSCKDAGTTRHAYAHDGWVVEVRCEK